MPSEHLAEQGLSRQVQAQVPFFLAAPAIVCGSELIATVPRTAAMAFRERWPLELFRSPFGSMRYVVHMTWSRHLESDEGHQWFRAEVREAAVELARSAATKDSPPSPGWSC